MDSRGASGGERFLNGLALSAQRQGRSECEDGQKERKEVCV